jgi:hypothetical protein
MDKDLENILKKANKDVKAEEKVEPIKVFPPNGPYDYLVFTKLVPFSGFNKTIFLFILPAALCFGFFFAEFRFATILILLIYAGLLVAYNIMNFFRFQAFKGWEEKLPFKLIGWREMIHKKKMFCDLCWNDTRITIEHEDGDPVIKELIQAALKLYCKKTELAFYDEDFGMGKRSRNYWKIISYNTAEGSASPEVMRYMKQLFEKELRIIAEKTGKIKSVKIELLSEEFQIKIRVNTGD